MIALNDNQPVEIIKLDDASMLFISLCLDLQRTCQDFGKLDEKWRKEVAKYYASRT